MENIGAIFVNNESNLVFKPNLAINYLTDSFGLASFNSPEIQRENIVAEHNTATEETPVIPLAETTKEDGVVVIQKSNTNWLKYAAAIALLPQQEPMVTKCIMIIRLNKKQIVHKTVQEKVNQTIQQATFIIPSPSTSIDLTIEETRKPYHIIAGAFRSETNAKKSS